MSNHKDREHALLSASGANRWLACAPSALLEAEFPELTNKWAEEGTARHEIAEQVLRNKLDGKRAPAFRDPEKRQMADEVRIYTDYVWDTYQTIKAVDAEAVLMLEQRVSYDDYVPGGGGTADAIIIGGNTLMLIDLKTGNRPVSVKGNAQLRLYALGAIQEFDFIYDFDRVMYCIVQTPTKAISTEEISTQELQTWGTEEVAPKAHAAIIGGDVFVEGEHCNYCKAASCCRHRLNAYQRIVQLTSKKPAELADTGEIAEVLRNGEQVKKFIDACMNFAVEAMQHGVKYPGVKLIQSAGRAVLIAGMEDELAKRLLTAGVDENLIYKPKELETRTNLIPLAGGKKAFESLAGDLYTKTEGKLKVDKAESSKPEWVPPNAAANDFDDEELKAYA